MINNEFYDQLKQGWYTADDHPIALLRAENRVRIPWIQKQIPPRSHVLDLGCGAGFLCNALALDGHNVSGVDLSETSLATARLHDTTQSVQYLCNHVYSLPFSNNSFDVVCAMDILEHIEEPQLLLAEASRVLKKGGLFFFHTFNRNLWSYLLVIKGVEWCVRNTPKNMHVYPLFIKPAELEEMCLQYDLLIHEIQGFQPVLFSRSFWKLLRTGKIPSDFTFCFSKNLKTGYCGLAHKR